MTILPSSTGTASAYTTREALNAACLRLQAFLDTFGDLADCVTQADLNDWIDASDGVAQSKRISGATDIVDEAACLIWAELCPGMVMGDDDRQHYENAAKAVLALTSTGGNTP